MDVVQNQVHLRNDSRLQTQRHGLVPGWMWHETKYIIGMTQDYYLKDTGWYLVGCGTRPGTS
jgi:hypothetical protein